MQKIKDLYISGKTPTQISEILGLSRGTIYYSKTKAKASGDDWDALVLLKKRTKEEVLITENEFLITLLSEFEKGFKALADLEAKERLKVLSAYAKSYYALKAPLKQDEKQNAYEIGLKVIKALADMATKDKNKAVVEFLNKNADLIVQAVL